MSAPGAVAGMTRAGGLGGGLGGGNIAARVSTMDTLVRRGALSPEEAARIRVSVLASETDPMPRLVDAANAMDQAIITPNEFAQVGSVGHRVRKRGRKRGRRVCGAVRGHGLLSWRVRQLAQLTHADIFR